MSSNKKTSVTTASGNASDNGANTLSTKWDHTADRILLLHVLAHSLAAYNVPLSAAQYRNELRTAMRGQGYDFSGDAIEKRHLELQIIAKEIAQNAHADISEENGFTRIGRFDPDAFPSTSNASTSAAATGPSRKRRATEMFDAAETELNHATRARIVASLPKLPPTPVKISVQKGKGKEKDVKGKGKAVAKEVKGKGKAVAIEEEDVDEYQEDEQTEVDELVIAPDSPSIQALKRT